MKVSYPLAGPYANGSTKLQNRYLLSTLPSPSTSEIPPKEPLLENPKSSRRYLIFTLLALSLHFMAFGQSGSVGDPFTQLGHAWHVPSSGTYYFNISGIAFSTYVEAGNGWILAISGSSSTSEASYPTTTSLTLQSDQILPSAIYTSTDVIKVRINATSGPAIPFDVESSHDDVLANLRSNITLSHVTYGTAWTGTGTVHMNKINCGVNEPLNTGIYHACNNQDGFHWIMSSDLERVDYNNGGKNNLNLWIRGAEVSLPVELYGFAARKDFNQVNLSWKTASEINNAGFQVQRSADGGKWSDLAFVSGHGTTTENHGYFFMDEKPLSGTNYYRLRQMDFDGGVEYSKVVSIDFRNHEDFGDLRVFPNPVSGGELTLVLPEGWDETTTVQLFSLASGGQLIQSAKLSGGKQNLDVSKLVAGIYILRVGQFYEKIVVQH